MKGHAAFREMEIAPGVRFAHPGMSDGAYYHFDGADFRYVYQGQEADTLVAGPALLRDDWYRLIDNDRELAALLEGEAELHVQRFRAAGEFELSMAAAYAHGLEHAAQLLRERSR